ncbi:MAG: 4Fe-4S binding protein [Dethiobacteria bacterium]|jgi:pyruvate ferredoxin oxidoreductase delta subunit
MKRDLINFQNWGWQKQPLGAVIPEAGNAHYYETGSWRSHRPIRDEEKCNQCLICFIFCPDTAIITEDEKVIGFDLDHCKGCGICAHECPRNAIEMTDEAKASQKE